jgi:hypothetical protein
MPLVPDCIHRPRERSWQEILNAIFYINKAGCSWRLLPSDFPHCLDPKMHLTGGVVGRLSITISDCGVNLASWSNEITPYENKLESKLVEIFNPVQLFLDSQSVKTSEKGGKRV